MNAIAPNDSNIVYSPYNWLVTGSEAKTICAGAYLRLMFSGTPTTLAATFDVSAGTTARVGIRIDGGSWQDSPIAASIPITMPTTNTWGTHTVELVMIGSSETAERWTTQATAVRFLGLVGDVTMTTRPVRRRNLYGMAFGDSITEGVRTLNSTATGDQNRNDVRLAWSLPLADLLGAELGVVGFGAVGITRSGSGGVPKFPLSAPYLWNGQQRAIGAPKEPDFIAAHIGTNDSAAAEADVTADTTSLLNGWLQSTARTVIFVLPGWLQRKASAIQAGINACSDPSRVQYVDTTGWWSTADASDALHPYGYINGTDLAPRLATVIRNRLGGQVTQPPSFFVNIGGTAKPVY